MVWIIKLFFVFGGGERLISDCAKIKYRSKLRGENSIIHYVGMRRVLVFGIVVLIERVERIVEPRDVCDMVSFS